MVMLGPDRLSGRISTRTVCCDRHIGRMEMKLLVPLVWFLLSGSFLLLANAQSERYDFFYFVLQWPGSYCDRAQRCCYPKTGKPDNDFSIHGLWPNREDGTYPEFCDPFNPFDASRIRDLQATLGRAWGSLDCPSSNSQKFWEHEWEKHGTCAFSNEHEYFQDSLRLRQKVDPLGYLQAAGIFPDNKKYSLQSIQLALENGLGNTVGIECNKDAEQTSQLYQIYFCVDTDASTIIDCPVFPNSKCSRLVAFPSFAEENVAGSDDENVSGDLIKMARSNSKR